ncbi:CGGC domain-containing protein [Succinispira mobilis]|uniref:CGGC domain-containing protein n=1 Tax=Succinispira mobilis TaxID=78120 RepID=UPI000374A183|nr:CGGC domain-containing protein [Succinispira mobilis]
MDKEQIKLIVIVQCEFASKRCSGHACMRSFYERTGTFQNYPSTTMYLSLTCGGCCGKGLVAKLEHLTKMNLKKWQLQRNQVTIHLASCICKDNYHADVCPHLDYIKNILYKKGYENLIEGSYLSDTATKKRNLGIYKK